MQNDKFLLKRQLGLIIIGLLHTLKPKEYLKLNLVPELKIFALKLIYRSLSTRQQLRKTDLNIDNDCPHCHLEEETIGHLFKQCLLSV